MSLTVSILAMPLDIHFEIYSTKLKKVDPWQEYFMKEVSDEKCNGLIHIIDGGH